MLQKELAIAKARLEASASHERARELEFEALHEQLNNARAAVDHLQAQNFRILEELEQASVPRHLQPHMSCILGRVANEVPSSSAAVGYPDFISGVFSACWSAFERVVLPAQHASMWGVMNVTFSTQLLYCEMPTKLRGHTGCTLLSASCITNPQMLTYSGLHRLSRGSSRAGRQAATVPPPCRLLSRTRPSS